MTRDETMAAMRAWLENWRRAGEALEEERLRGLEGLDDDTAREITCELFALWQPDEDANRESGLVEQQRLFRDLSLHQAVSDR